jgi:hypothetical protein
MKVDKKYVDMLESYSDRIVEETVYLSEDDLAKLIEEKINRAKIYHEAYIKNFDKLV